MEFVDRIKQVRKQLNLSQTVFAKELNIARATLVRWETGKFKPNYDALKRFDDFCRTKGILTTESEEY